MFWHFKVPDGKTFVLIEGEQFFSLKTKKRTEAVEAVIYVSEGTVKKMR